MKAFSAISLLLLASSATTVQAQRQQKHRSIRAATAVEDEQHRRRGKKEDGETGAGGDPNRGGTVGGVITGLAGGALVDFPGACMPFTLANGDINSLALDAIAIANGGHSQECNTNSCASAGSPGCCRYHTNLLVCDLKDEYRTQAVRDEGDEI
jgi:hypothetical protein